MPGPSFALALGSCILSRTPHNSCTELLDWRHRSGPKPRRSGPGHERKPVQAAYGWGIYLSGMTCLRLVVSKNSGIAEMKSYLARSGGTLPGRARGLISPSCAKRPGTRAASPSYLLKLGWPGVCEDGAADAVGARPSGPFPWTIAPLSLAMAPQLARPRRLLRPFCSSTGRIPARSGLIRVSGIVRLSDRRGHSRWWPVAAARSEMLPSMQVWNVGGRGVNLGLTQRSTTTHSAAYYM